MAEYLGVGSGIWGAFYGAEWNNGQFQHEWWFRKHYTNTRRFYVDVYHEWLVDDWIFAEAHATKITNDEVIMIGFMEQDGQVYRYKPPCAFPRYESVGETNSYQGAIVNTETGQVAENVATTFTLLEQIDSYVNSAGLSFSDVIVVYFETRTEEDNAAYTEYKKEYFALGIGSIELEKRDDYSLEVEKYIYQWWYE